jgi:hypothetical protein
MYTFVSQDLVTIAGPGTAGLVTTQSEHAWLELPGFPNAVAWLQVFDLNVNSGVVAISYQTAPTADEGLFQPMYGPQTSVPFTPTIGVTVTPLVKDLMTVPLGRWFRWQLTTAGTFSGAWNITFRLYLAAHSLDPGVAKRRHAAGGHHHGHVEHHHGAHHAKHHG